MMIRFRTLPRAARAMATNERRAATLPAIRPSAGLEIEYQRELHRLIEEMQKSLVWWLAAAYRAKPPEMASDELRYQGSPSMVMQRVMDRLSRRWQKRFNEAAPVLADYFATAVAERNDRALKSSLRKAGISVKLQMTAPMNDVLRATMNEQVGLIRSIAQQHLTEVQGLVMRSVAKGGDLAELSAELKARYGVTRRRAALIARDQNSKATATITRVRQEGLGITEAVWKHSHAGKTPRPSHVAADGQTYNIKEGMLIDGKRTWPGVEINCRCFSKPILPKLS
jgi:SPP1 gp7 family putative phage head morphogenesis protein